MNGDKNSKNCYMCALYENYLYDDYEGIMYKPSHYPHCLSKHDMDKNGALISDFDRYIDRECHAPSYHKLLLVDEDLRNASNLDDAYHIFSRKYLNNTNNE